MGRFGGAPGTTMGLGVVDTPQEAQAAVDQYLQSLCPWRLGALYLCTSSTKSLVISTALAAGHINSEEALKAARVEEDYQTELWGVVEGGHDWDMVSMEVVVAKTAF